MPLPGSSGFDTRSGFVSMPLVQTHPTTLRAFERRMETILQGKKPLTPEQTAVYRKPCIGDYDRLSVPQFRRKFRKKFVAEAVNDLCCSTVSRCSPVKPSSSQQHHARDGDVSRDLHKRPHSALHLSSTTTAAHGRLGGGGPGQPSRAPSIFDASVVFTSSCVELESEPLITRKDQQRMDDEERLAKMAVRTGPSEHALRYTLKKEERFAQSRLSKRLFHAVHGQALEKVMASAAKKADAANFSKLFNVTGNPMNNSIFLSESHCEVFSPDGGGGGARENGGGAGDEGIGAKDPGTAVTSAGAVPLAKLADAAFRSSITSITSREYILLRQLFVEIDDDRSGFLEIEELVSYQKQFPKRLGSDVLEHLPLEIDGRIYLDDFIVAHFPNVEKGSIEQLMILHEPKVQASMTSLAPESLRSIVRGHQSILDDFGHLTLQNWITATLQQQQQLTKALKEAAKEEVPVKAAAVPGLTSQPAAAAAVTSAGKRPPLRRTTSTPATAGVASAGEPNQQPAQASAMPALPAGSGAAVSASSPTPRELSSRGLPATSIPLGGTASSLTGTTSMATSGPILSTINAYQFFCHMNRATDVSISEFVNICKLRQLNLRPNKAEILASGVHVLPGSLDSPIIVPDATGSSSGAVSGVALKKEPNVPFLLACPITQKDFLVLVADYYAMVQSNEHVNVFNPSFREQLDSWKWERLFPYTGPIRNYFKHPGS